MALSMAQPVEEVLTDLGLIEPDDVEEIWNHPDWATMREVYEKRRAWYKGTEWTRTDTDQRDPSGDLELQWPLQLNPIAKVCRIHRAVMLGMQKGIVDEAPISTLVSRVGLGEGQREQADTLQALINRVWYASNAAAVQFKSCLTTQYYGDQVFRIAWEPYNIRLPDRIAIHSLETPAYFFPKAYNPFNPWELLDCYVGYEIDKDLAQLHYGITPKDSKTDKVLYIEHWSTDAYRVTVDGQVPVFRTGDSGPLYKMEGENRWGLIPIVHIPHERDSGFYGRSLVDDDSSLVGLSKELNARMADKGESVQDSKPLIWIHDARNASWAIKEVVNNDGETLFRVLDIGSSPTLPGAASPEIGITESRGLPDSANDFPDDLWAEIRRAGDVASVAMGDDDTVSGRITGPVTAYRMWPTMMHTMAERAFFSIGMQHIAKVIATIANERQGSVRGGYEEFKVRAPGITDEMLDMEFITSWRPMIPIEETQRTEQLNNMLKVGGISVRRYLELMGVQDIDAEEERIWEDREKEAEIAAEAQATAFQSRFGEQQQQGGGQVR